MLSNALFVAAAAISSWLGENKPPNASPVSRSTSPIFSKKLSLFTPAIPPPDKMYCPNPVAKASSSSMPRARAVWVLTKPFTNKPWSTPALSRSSGVRPTLLRAVVVRSGPKAASIPAATLPVTAPEPICVVAYRTLAVV